MLLMLLGALAIVWLLAIAVVIGLCVSAAQSDRGMARAARRRTAVASQSQSLRLIA